MEPQIDLASLIILSQSKMPRVMREPVKQKEAVILQTTSCILDVYCRRFCFSFFFSLFSACVLVLFVLCILSLEIFYIITETHWLTKSITVGYYNTHVAITPALGVLDEAKLDTLEVRKKDFKEHKQRGKYIIDLNGENVEQIFTRK